MSQPDVNGLFDDNVAITATRDSTNHIMVSGALGTGTFNNVEFIGNEIWVDFLVTQAFATIVTLNIAIFGSADDSTFDTVPLVQTGLIPVARLTLGNKFQLIIPALLPGGYTIPKYLKVVYTVATNATTGKIDARIVMTRQPAT